MKKSMKLKKNIYMMMFGVIIFAMGCAHTPHEMTLYENAQRFSPTEPDSIRVYEKQPTKEFIEIGEIKVEYAENWQNAKEVFKKKAAQAGGDGVYILDTSHILKKEYYFTPVSYYGYYDPWGYHYYYGPNRFGYRYDYPGGYYHDTDTLLVSTGVIIKFTQLGKENSEDMNDRDR
ncbi:MAG: hypothetical protein GF384_01010 [Elusimicrobia bacterium]|nr:hypothetical protein [Elusimicrobiota bacterium]